MLHFSGLAFFLFLILLFKNSWVYFNSRFETLALGPNTAVILSRRDNFLHCQIYKRSFSTFFNTDQHADLVHVWSGLSTELTQADSSETLVSPAEEGEGA